MIRESAELRDRVRVFRDRAHAGLALAALLADRVDPEAVVLAVPAGGVPVAAALARALALPLDVAVVSKLTLPWNREVGYGAVAFDGTVRLNRPLIARLGLREDTVRRGLDETRARVRRRVAALAGGPRRHPWPPRAAILVDDGLASGFTLGTAVEALRAAGTEHLVVAVPTGAERSLRALEPEVDALVCANVRGGPSFAVADAYEVWSDVSESEAALRLEEARSRGGG